MMIVSEVTIGSITLELSIEQRVLDTNAGKQQSEAAADI
jgi:hypothetical protein